MTELKTDMEIWLGMPLTDLQVAHHRDTSRRHWDQPLSCVKCGADAKVYYVADAPGIESRWLDLCPRCDSDMRTTPMSS